MALFEFDEGRLIPAQFGRSVSGGLTPEVVDAVCNQVLEIVSRPLFPITWRDISPFEAPAFIDESSPENEAPRLTALDPSGQVVSVEILDFLDSDTLIQSLSRLAGTAALSWSDLAREYPGGVAAFKSGWLHFRDSMPPSPGAGPRLVMVVGSIDPAVRPALEVLAASGVEVHEMSLREMSNGRSFLEVHAVGPRTYAHAPHLLAGRSEDVPAILLEAPQANCEFTADGLLRAGEQTWTDPQEALVHFQVGGDAWALWHLGGEEGPTLGESLAEVNREIIREYSREG